METLQVDDLALEVRRSPRRRSLRLTVDRGGELIITSPPDASDDELTAFVREKQFWVYAKLAEKAALQQPVGGKQFVSGEGFYYLGRSYRALLVDKQTAPLKLIGGRFRLRRDEAHRGRVHFIRWYSEHAHPWLSRRVDTWASRMEVEPSGIEVRDLGYRWGSCGRSGGLNFHWAAILLPPSIVDYVVVHELAHLREPTHSTAFWTHVGRTLPEYESRKRWLAEQGGAYATI